MKKLVFIIALFYLSHPCVFALTGSADEAYNSQIYWKAKASFTEADYKRSLLFFNYLLDQDPDNSELNGYVGLCYKNLSKEKVANFYFNKASNDQAMMLLLKIEDLRTSHLSSVKLN